MDDENLFAFGTGAAVAEEDVDSGIAKNGQILNALTALENGIQGEGLDGVGIGESFLFGAPNTTSSDRSFVQNALRATTGVLNPELSESRTARNRLTAEDYINAYDSLRGAGQITEFEAKTAANAESVFSQEDATSEAIQNEINRSRAIIEGGNYRNTSGIQIGPNGLETLNGVPVLTYRDEQGNFQHTEIPDGRQIYNIPDWLTEDAAKNAVSGLPAGSEYFYNGQIYNRDNL